jgi:hypothetical protein
VVDDTIGLKSYFAYSLGWKEIECNWFEAQESRFPFGRRILALEGLGRLHGQSLPTSISKKQECFTESDPFSRKPG